MNSKADTKTRCLVILFVSLNLTVATSAGIATSASPSRACLWSESRAERKAYLTLTNSVYAAIANGQSLGELDTTILNQIIGCQDGEKGLYSLDAKTGVQINIVEDVMTAWRPNPKAPSKRERAGFYVRSGEELTEDEAFARTSGAELRYRGQ